jgi:hypothetical protein
MIGIGSAVKINPAETGFRDRWSHYTGKGSVGLVVDIKGGMATVIWSDRSSPGLPERWPLDRLVDDGEPILKVVFDFHEIAAADIRHDSFYEMLVEYAHTDLGGYRKVSKRFGGDDYRVEVHPRGDAIFVVFFSGA